MRCGRILHISDTVGECNFTEINSDTMTKNLNFSYL